MMHAKKHNTENTMHRKAQTKVMQQHIAQESTKQNDACRPAQHRKLIAQEAQRKIMQQNNVGPAYATQHNELRYVPLTMAESRR